MSKQNYKEQVTYNMASSLGAAIRNSLTQDVVESGQFQDAETAGERLTKLLKRMQELGQYDQEIVTGVLISMLHQSGDLHDVADYCHKHGSSNIETAKRCYKRYSQALAEADFIAASKAADIYNFYLKRAGGPEKHPSEAYLSMGENKQKSK